jgi:hypothetical protein
MLAFLLFFLTPSAHAQNLCQSAPCNQAQKEIQAAYNAHPGFLPSAAGKVFSGGCYHLWPQIDPAHEHYGLAVVDSTSSGYIFRGLFSFFAPSDPYKGMTYAQVDDLLRREGGEPSPMKIDATDGTVIFRSASGTIRYWIRSDGTDLYLLGFWSLDSGSVQNFCHFTAGGA